MVTPALREKYGQRSAGFLAIDRFRRAIPPEYPQFANYGFSDSGTIQTGLNLNQSCHRFIWLA